MSELQGEQARIFVLSVSRILFVCDIIRPRGTPTEINNKIPDVSHTYFLYTCNFIESVKCLIYRGYRILTALFQFNDDFYRNLDQV